MRSIVFCMVGILYLTASLPAVAQPDDTLVIPIQYKEDGNVSAPVKEDNVPPESSQAKDNQPDAPEEILNLQQPSSGHPEEKITPEQQEKWRQWHEQAQKSDYKINDGRTP